MRHQPRLQEIVDERRVVPVPPDDELRGRAEGLDDGGAVGRGHEAVGLFVWSFFLCFLGPGGRVAR